MTIRTPRSRWAVPAIALLALASSIVGIVNQFTYDDRYIIEMNRLMRAPNAWLRVFTSSYWPRDWGGDGYRPLTILAFKLEYATGGGHPMVFHAVNIALYVVASVLVFSLARRLLPLWAAWITAALFAVHPVHVEAVANVVGQSELIVGVALLAATVLYIRDRQAGPLRLSTGAALLALYAIACFAKEHGIVLPAILAAAEVIVIRDERAWRERIRALRPFYLLTVVVALSFVGVRSLVLADHSIGGFAPFTPFNTLHISNADRMLTALGVVPQWLRLLYWPAHLSSEYGPPAVEIAQGPSVLQLPGLALLIGILLLGVLLRRKQPVVSFGIALACIALLPSSNFILPAGIVLAERTLFLTSVGAMLVAGAVAVLVVDRAKARVAGTANASGVERIGQVLVALLLALGLVRSVTRTTIWHDNDRLFRQAVIDSPMAYRAHYMLGAWDFENKRKREGEAEYRKALNLFPYDPFLAYNMAEQYRMVGLCGPAVPLYRWTHGLDPNFSLGNGAFAWCLLNEGQYAEAKTRALDAIRLGSDVKDMRRVIFLADSAGTADRRKGATVRPAGVPARGKLPETMQKAASGTSGATRG